MIASEVKGYKLVISGSIIKSKIDTMHCIANLTLDFLSWVDHLSLALLQASLQHHTTQCIDDLKQTVKYQSTSSDRTDIFLLNTL